MHDVHIITLIAHNLMYGEFEVSFSANRGAKMSCDVCRRILPNIASLYRLPDWHLAPI